MSLPITATIITLNEEENIRQVIESVKSTCNEIIVIDSQSNDKTVEIAKELGAKVYIQKYLGDGLQKDFGVQYATNDWILSIDADERLEESCIQAINDLDLQDGSYDAYAFKRKTFVGNRWQKVWYPDYVTRLYNSKKCRYLPIAGHSKVDTENYKKLSVAMLHYSYTDFSDMIQKIDKFSSRGARLLFQNGKRVGKMSPITHGIASFFKEYIIKRGIFYGRDGLTITLISSFSTYMKYALLLDLQENEKL